MFGRSKSDTPAPSVIADEGSKAGGKGRPTPSRKEAEAAARARARVPRTRKEQAAADRAARNATNARLREAYKSGEDRYLPSRDRGPIKRFVRDFVDSRFSFIEIMIPLLLVSMVLGYSGNVAMMNFGNLVLFVTLALVIIDMFTLHFRVKREMGRRFPDEPTKGISRYAIMRALQMKFMRLPKAQVKLGDTLPEHYR